MDGNLLIGINTIKKKECILNNDTAIHEPGN